MDEKTSVRLTNSTGFIGGRLLSARVRCLKGWVATVPVLTPKLWTFWVNLITTVPAGIACPLKEGLKRYPIKPKGNTVSWQQKGRRMPGRQT